MSLAISSEEQRAIAYQLQQAARLRYEQLTQAQLRGSVDQARIVRDGWSPIINRDKPFRIGEHQ
jgi:hypothetical protein